MDLKTFELSDKTFVKVIAHRQILGFGITLEKKLVGEQGEEGKEPRKLKLSVQEFRRLKTIIPSFYGTSRDIHAELQLGGNPPMKARHVDLSSSMRASLMPYTNPDGDTWLVMCLSPIIIDETAATVAEEATPANREEEESAMIASLGDKGIALTMSELARLHRMYPAIHRHIATEGNSTMKILKLSSPADVVCAKNWIDYFWKHGRGYIRLCLQKSWSRPVPNPNDSVTMPYKEFVHMPKLKVVGGSSMPKKNEKIMQRVKTDHEEIDPAPFSLSMWSEVGGGFGNKEETQEELYKIIDTLRISELDVEVENETRYGLAETCKEFDMDPTLQWIPRCMREYDEGEGDEMLDSDLTEGESEREEDEDEEDEDEEGVYYELTEKGRASLEKYKKKEQKAAAAAAASLAAASSAAAASAAAAASSADQDEKGGDVEMETEEERFDSTTMEEGQRFVCDDQYETQVYH